MNRLKDQEGFLFIEEEAIVVKKVELAVSDSFDEQIHVLSDPSCNSRHFNQTGLNCISLNWVDEMRESGRIPDSCPSTIEVLVTTANERGARIIGSALCLDRAPNSVSFDGPICCSSMSNGSAFFIPLLSLQSALCVAKSDPSRKPPKIPESIIDKLKLVLSKPPTYLLPANEASLSLHRSCFAFCGTDNGFGAFGARRAKEVLLDSVEDEVDDFFTDGAFAADRPAEELSDSVEDEVDDFFTDGAFAADRAAEELSDSVEDAVVVGTGTRSTSSSFIKNEGTVRPIEDEEPAKYSQKTCKSTKEWNFCQKNNAPNVDLQSLSESMSESQFRRLPPLESPASGRKYQPDTTIRLTISNVATMCETLLRQREDQIREEYDKILAEKLKISPTLKKPNPNVSIVMADEDKLASLWKSFRMLKRNYNEMRNETDKDLSTLRDDITRSKRQMHAACLNLNAKLRTAEPRQSLDRMSDEKSQVEQQLREKVSELIELQDDFEKERAALKSTIATMQGELESTRDSLRSERENSTAKADLSALNMSEINPAGFEDLQEQKAQLEQALRDIANCVIADTELSVAIPEAESLRGDGARSPTRSTSPSRRSRRLRSPGRAVSPTFAMTTYDATKSKLDETITENNDAKREITRKLASAETAQAEKDGLNRTRNNLQAQLEGAQVDIEKLRSKIAELSSQKESAEEDREELQALLKRRDEDDKRSQRNIELLEQRGSSLKEELIAIREQLKKSELERDVADQERHETSEALQRAECALNETELKLNHLRTEEAGSREQLAKFAALNEGLAADKTEEQSELGLHIRSIKGSAVFWYNLLPNGSGDERTRHAACPVLRGLLNDPLIDKEDLEVTPEDLTADLDEADLLLHPSAESSDTLAIETIPTNLNA
ncbi:Oidioi.mRNA.OKI2018_I69.YSR.g17126.t1.cds [Oikopleura dioica]|uniref:Oidioi.mRNA.OKI2018_I69.YSR.g17126.t1.cds n=1 Tax=Oikopleura dioica TaxID=34765 RepID=A0ABN7SI83_OIKDI|nr:Oidioi.mRNA.OKI2018_I69.YSR.g17126.t1.cds [Oikopleura dioica]